MEYIAYKRFKGQSLSGYVNIPRGTVCEAIGGVIIKDNKPIANVHSYISFKHFARNDDKRGLQRGDMITQIKELLKNPEIDSDYYSSNIIYKTEATKNLKKANKLHDERWKKIFNDSSLIKFRNTDHSDVWLWNDLFYQARLEDLNYIITLITNGINLE